MVETAKADKKRDEKICGETKKTEKSIRAKYTEFGKGPVASDNIQKEVNNCERKLETSRFKKYDYLTGAYLQKVLAEECAKAGIPVDTFDTKSSRGSNAASTIALEPSPTPVPRVSSAIIGWRSSSPKYTLELVGPLYISPKRTIEPPLIPGEFRVTDQKFIFLG